MRNPCADPSVDAGPPTRFRDAQRPELLGAPRGHALGEIEAISRREKVEAARWRHECLVVVDDDIAAPDDVELVSAHDDGRVLVQSDAEKLRMLRDDVDEVELPIAAQEMLIDGGVL